MAGYSKFQTDNVKFSKDRNDIYNPSFETPVKLSDGDFIDKNLDKWMELISFLRWYPDIAYKMIEPEKGKKLELDIDQIVTLRLLVRNPDVYMCVIRGYGKTMLHIMAQYHIARFFPSAKLSVTASTKESATSIWKAKHEELLEYYPILRDEIKSESFSKDSGKVIFVNGATVDSLANTQQSKGQRRHRGGLEESNIIDKATLEDAVLPIFNVPRKTMGNLVDPEELNGQVNRYTTSGFKNSDEYEVIVNVLRRQYDVKGSYLIGSDWILPVYFGRQKKSVIDKARNGSITSFKQNYLCEWVGATSGALLNVSKLIKARSIKIPELECEKDKKKNPIINEYVFGVDVARSASDSNNKSAITILKIIRNKSGEIRQVHAVNMLVLPNGLTYEEQSMEIKRLFYKYGGNINIDKSMVKAIVVDANTIGQGLIEALLKDDTDYDTNKELGCFATINTDDKSKDRDAPQLVYALKSQGINGSIIRNFINYVESSKLKLLMEFKHIESNIQEELKLEYNLSCDNTDLFIDEVANLKIKSTKNNSDITVEQVVRRIDKDRYSATAYGLYYIDMFMQIESNDEEYDYVFTSG